jgi:hypothetical protein
MCTVAILQSNYIPWKGYFDLIAAADVFVIYDEVQYTKNDWRNRNLIKTPNGQQWLTIPVRQVTLDQRICDTRISDPSWSRKHIGALQANYARAPYFDRYKMAIFEELVRSRELLTEINVGMIRTLCELLGITTKIMDSRELDVVGDRNSRLLDACKKLGATHYLSGPAAQGYLDLALFEEGGIEVNWMDYSGYAEYNQLFPPFVHGVSVLDLLFNAGPEASACMKFVKS